jgi:hypothetical protein
MHYQKRLDQSRGGTPFHVPTCKQSGALAVAKQPSGHSQLVRRTVHTSVSPALALVPSAATQPLWYVSLLLYFIFFCFSFSFCCSFRTIRRFLTDMDAEAQREIELLAMLEEELDESFEDEEAHDELFDSLLAGQPDENLPPSQDEQTPSQIEAVQAMRDTVSSHMPLQMDFGSRCVLCLTNGVRQNSCFRCQVCNVYLCVVCFMPYHKNN